ncbi:PAS domain-containing sensor histidine kinase [Pedobacter sp. L105]|uniref:PAS domain-containing sensor histidine kinase n=1 Tax=Pedobacter sp. L105 TaxID=1641871 RepID=UPI00131D6334|nr:PAS domain-containing sensor histidine kinase [Pedobacter sp. L105]
MSTSTSLNEKQLLNILSFYTNPVAIYTSHEIVIEMANNAMLAAWGRGPEIIGQTLGAALPEISNQPFVKMLQQVWNTGIDDIGEAIIADLVIDGILQRFYFDYQYLAIKNEFGEVYAIMHTALDVTEKTLSREALELAKEKEAMLQREQSLNEELAATNEELSATNEELYRVQNKLQHLNTELEERVKRRTESLARSESRLRYLLSDAPVAIAVFYGKEMILESANKKVLEAWGKTEEIIGKPLKIGVPELVGQDFLTILDQVFTTGMAYHGYEVKALLEQNGKIEEVYSNFVYQPLKDEEGQTQSIMLAASVVSEQVAARHRVQQLNEELIVINEELSESQAQLITLNIHLKESESRLDQILSELPAPIVVLMGPEQIISTTNKALLEFWDRTKEEVAGKPMLEVFPELVNQPFPALWKHVLETGERIVNREKQVVFKNKNNGEDKPFFVDYYYQPLTGVNGERTGVLATVIDVTDKVNSRRKVEEAETQLRLAIESTELGTWYINAVTREFVPSARLKEIYGFRVFEEMPYAAAMEQIVEGYRDDVKNAVEEAISSGQHYDMEYPITSFHDGQIKWVRATGKLYIGENITGANFTGTVQDITERKSEEQRKDDFLSIASHELKTPVTTLKGALQLLDRFKVNPLNPVIPRLIDQANVSIEKITNLMDDLLNTTRTNEGQLHLTKTRFTIAEMLEKCCSHVRMGGKHDLIVQGDENLQIDADEARIDQVVVNLVNNAAKYAPDSREIYLIIEDLGDKARISVKDNGPGIPEDKLSHLFERYYRADYGGVQYSGLGLGLYISAEIVKRHGGEIGVDSQVGAGSTFWFTLPY